MKKLSFLKGFIMLGLAGTSFASDPVITLDDTAVEVSYNEDTIGFSTDQSYANLQIEFIQALPEGVAVLRGGGSNGQQIFIPMYTREGQWIVNKVSYDTDEGLVVYRRVPYTEDGELALTEAMGALSIYVANLAPDTEAPNVTEFDIDLDQLTKSDDGQTLYAPCTITVTDDHSGFRSVEGGFTGSGDADAFVSMLISEDDRNGSSNIYEGYVEFIDAQPGEVYTLSDIFLQDNAGNAIYYSEWSGDKTVNNYTVSRTEPFPAMFAIEIQLPESFDDIPLRSSSGSGASPSASSSSGPVVQSVKKIKKGKKGKDSAKNSKSSKKKGSSAKKSKGSKKSSGKKSKSVQK